MPLHSPRLWVVATPLGNPGDLSPRARSILEQADLILAEDTRRAGLFFKRHGMQVKGRVRSLFEHNEQDRVPATLEALGQGLDVALMSDAGTPLIGDPGYRLVRACRAAGFFASPVPGPCSAVAALSASGLPPYPFAFLGFLPRKAGEIRRLLASWTHQSTTLVFFERNSRLKQTLEVAAEVLGPRQICLARELTKEHEQFILGRLEDHCDLQWDPRGEMTVVVGPPEQGAKSSTTDVDRMILEESQSRTPRDIAARVAARASGWSSKDIYARIVFNPDQNTAQADQA